MTLDPATLAQIKEAVAALKQMCWSTPAPTLHVNKQLLTQVVIEPLDHAAELLAAIPRWQPIETAPKDGTPVLVWLPEIYQGKGGHMIALFKLGFWRVNPSAWRCEPTRWMPLPKEETDG